MRIATSLRCPKVPEPVCLPPIQIITRRSDEIPELATSESNWDGKSVEAGSSAGAYREVSPGVSDNGLLHEGPVPPVNRSRAYLDSVQKWMENVIDSNADMVPVDEPIHPLPPPAEVAPQNQPFFGGEWLAPEARH